MARSSTVHYIPPSQISLVPNCNGTFNDIAVTIERGTEIQVYSPAIAELKPQDGDYQRWTLTGRNRRLADDTKPYTIFARLPKTGERAGYLVFCAKRQLVDGGEWLDTRQYVTPEGLADIEGVFIPDGNWYIRLGDVSLPENGLRTLTFDTGILGTPQYNEEWEVKPEELPLRVELGCTINDEDVGLTPYLYWGQELVLTASLMEGWSAADSSKIDHWEISRDTGDVQADAAWNRPTGENRRMADGSILLRHARGAGDDFNGAVAAVFTVTAVGTDAEGSVGPVATTTISILAETVERYEMAMSSSVMSYNPQTKRHNPDGGINVYVRATDQRNNTFNITNGQAATAGLAVEYAAVSSSGWTRLTFSGSQGSLATVTIPKTAFSAQENVNVRLVRIVSADGQEVSATEIARTTVAFVRDGEDSREREWIFLRTTEPVVFGTAAHPKPASITRGQVGPDGAAADGSDSNPNQDGWVPQGWWDDQQGVDEQHPYEYGAYRDYQHGASTEDGQWGPFSDPKLWNHFGQDGDDAYTVQANPATVSFQCDPTGRSIDSGVRNVTLSMFKGAAPVSFSATVANAENCRAWVEGSVLHISTYYNSVYSDLAQGGSVTVTLTDTADGVQRSLTIPVVGNRQGGQGVPGVAGPMLYPAGQWEAKTYVASGNSRPYVLYTYTDASGKVISNYYYLSADSAAADEPPVDASGNPSDKWTLMTQAEVVYAKFGIMDYGELASAVFCGDWMYSQYGRMYKDGTSYVVDNENNDPVTIDGRTAEPFAWFDPDHPEGGGDGTFAPNWAVNLKTGAQYSSGMKVFFNADGSGYLAGGGISWNKNGEITITSINDAENGNVLNGLIDFQNMFGSSSWISGGVTELRIQPKRAFDHIDLKRGTPSSTFPITDNSVLNFSEMKSRFQQLKDVPTTWPWAKITGTPTTLAEYGITDAATAAQMTAATRRLTALESLFDANGVAKSALRLSGNGTYTAWGQTWWQDGVPKGNVNGDLVVIDPNGNNVTDSAKIRFGNIADGQNTHNCPYIQGISIPNQATFGRRRLGFFTTNATTDNTGWVEALSIHPNGNIGINTTEPQQKLHVVGNIMATGAVSALGYSADGGGTGGATYLRELLDVNIGGTPSAGQVLTFRNGYWVAETMQVPTPDLSAYATQAWIQQNWQIKSLSNVYNESPYAIIHGDYIPYDVQLVNGVLTVTYGQLPFQTVYWEDIEDRPQVVTALGVSGDYVTWTREGVTNQLTVPFATRASELRRNHISSGTLDANDMTISGTKYAIAANYYSTDAWANAPSGMSYGAVMELTAGSGVGVLSGQLAWDVTHNSTTPTRRLWWRARNSSGWGNDWKEIAFADGYLPLTAGSEKPLTGSLYFSGNTGINWADGAGMLACKPTSGWTGISSTQWGVGSLSAQGVIRSNNSDLLHYKNSTSYTIWDSSNFRAGTEYTPWTDFQEFASNIQANYATTAALNTALTGYLPLTAGSGKPLTGILWMNADLVLANPNNTTNDSSQKIAFYTNKNYPNISPYIQAIYESSYGRKRLSVFQKNIADWNTPQTEVLSVMPDGKLRLTQAIAYKGTKATYDMITFLDNASDAFGNGIAIGGGGTTIIGGGESAATMAAQLSNGGSELMYIGNDGAVSVFTNLQDGWSDRKEFYFGADGRFWLPAGTGGRQMILHPDGQFQVRAVTGGWAYTFGAYTNAGSASLGQFGSHGVGDSLTYMYIGRAYNDTWMVAKPSGNVGIGTTTPNDYKLDVAGAIRASGSGGYGIVLDNDQAVTLRDSTGAHMRSMFLNSVNRLAIGYGTTKTGGYDTQLCGHEIILSTGGGSGTDPIEAARFTADGKLKIGNGYIEWDYTNNMLKFSGGNGIYALGAVSALGIAGDLDGQVTRAMTFTEAVTMRGTLSLAGTINTDVTIGQYKSGNYYPSRKLYFGDQNHYIFKDNDGDLVVSGSAYFDNSVVIEGGIVSWTNIYSDFDFKAGAGVTFGAGNIDSDGYGRLYAKADGKLYWKATGSSVEREIKFV